MAVDPDEFPLRPIRPRSVTILAWLEFLQSMALLGFGIYMYFLAGWTSVFPAEVTPAFQFLPLAMFDNMVSGFVLVLLALLGILTAFALLRLKSWAWMAAIILQGLGLTAGLIGYLNRRPNYIGMVIGIFLVLYLNQHEVRGAFREQRGE